MKTNIKFVRYGGLSPVKQTQYVPDSDPGKSFHNPPKKRGLYAMIKGYEETFLLGSTSDPDHISGKSQWLKDDEGNLIEDDRDWDSEKKSNDGYILTTKLKKLIKKRGIKENQLGSTQIKEQPECPTDVIECEACPLVNECNEARRLFLTVLKKPKVFTYTGDVWHHLGATTEHHEIKARSGDWVKTDFESFEKAFNKDKHLNLKGFHKDDYYVNDFTNDGRDPYKTTSITYSKDHLEVFIEKIK